MRENLRLKQIKNTSAVIQHFAISLGLVVVIFHPYIDAQGTLRGRNVFLPDKIGRLINQLLE